MIIEIFYHPHLVKSTLNYALSCDSAVLLHQVFFEGTAVYSYPYRYISLFRSLHHFGKLLLSANISWIYPYLVNAVLNGLNRESVVKMYVPN